MAAILFDYSYEVLLSSMAANHEMQVANITKTGRAAWEDVMIAKRKEADRQIPTRDLS